MLLQISYTNYTLSFTTLKMKCFEGLSFTSIIATNTRKSVVSHMLENKNKLIGYLHFLDNNF